MACTTYGTALAMYQNRIWSFTRQGVESYDPHTDTWRTEASPSVNRVVLEPHGSTKTNSTLLAGESMIVAPFSLIETYDPKKSGVGNIG